MVQTPEKWHSLSTQEALAKLDSGANGLTLQEAEMRLGVYGPNELKKTEREIAS